MYMAVEEASDMVLFSDCACAYEQQHDKTNNMACAPSEDSDQPGRGWSESSLCAQWVAKVSFLHADSKNSYQIARMPRLIWVFTGRTCHFVGFIMLQLIWNNSKHTVLRSPFTWDGLSISYQDNLPGYSLFSCFPFRHSSSLHDLGVDYYTVGVGSVSQGRTGYCSNSKYSNYSNPHELERLRQPFYDCHYGNFSVLTWYSP